MNNDSIVKQFDEYLKKNTVKDLICSTTKIVLICESPHTEELNKGLPLVGSAGKSAFKHLWKSKGVGLGEYLLPKTLPTIGIMNVCTAPLQKTDSPKQTPFDFSKLSMIRTRYSSISKHRDQDLNKIEKCILDDFKKRLKVLLKSNDITKIILCGKFAERYFDEIKQELEPVTSESLPHPARNGWSKLTDGQECILEELRNAIRC